MTDLYREACSKAASLAGERDALAREVEGLRAELKTMTCMWRGLVNNAQKLHGEIKELRAKLLEANIWGQEQVCKNVNLRQIAEAKLARAVGLLRVIGCHPDAEMEVQAFLDGIVDESPVDMRQEPPLVRGAGEQTPVSNSGGEEGAGADADKSLAVDVGTAAPAPNSPCPHGTPPSIECSNCAFEAFALEPPK